MAVPSLEQLMSVSIDPYLHQHLVLLVFWILVILIGVSWYHIVLLGNSLKTYDVEYLFICLLAICICALVRWLFRSLAHFLTGLFILFASMSWLL